MDCLQAYARGGSGLTAGAGIQATRSFGFGPPPGGERQRRWRQARRSSRIALFTFGFGLAPSPPAASRPGAKAAADAGTPVSGRPPGQEPKPFGGGPAVGMGTKLFARRTFFFRTACRPKEKYPALPQPDVRAPDKNAPAFLLERRGVAVISAAYSPASFRSSAFVAASPGRESPRRRPSLSMIQ